VGVCQLSRWLRAFEQASRPRDGDAKSPNRSNSANSSFDRGAGSGPIGANGPIVTVGTGAVGAAGAAHLNVAVVECLHANLPTEWIDGLAKLGEMSCPFSVQPNRWRRLNVDAARFVVAWGASAAALGWETLDLFGCHPLAPDQRYDYMGIVWLLTGASVAAVSADSMAMRTKSGAKQTVYRPRLPLGDGRVPIWSLNTRADPIRIPASGSVEALVSQ